MPKQSIPVLSLTLRATATINSARFIRLDGTQSGAGTYSAGVSRSAAAITEDFTYDALGTGLVEAGATVLPGALLESDANGRAITRTTGIPVARALEGASTGQTFEVMLIPN